MRELSEPIRLPKNYKHTIEVVVDRLVAKQGIRRRVADSIETALELAEGIASIAVTTHEGHEEIQTFSQKLACTYCGLSFDELAPRNFSFNSPYGACPTCDGLGSRLEVDADLVVPDPTLSINEGALAPWASNTLEYWYRVLEAVGEAHGFSLDTPWKKLPKRARDVVLYGSDEEIYVRYKQPLRTPALVLHHLRRSAPQPRAPVQGDGLGCRAGEDGAVHAGDPVPCVQGRPAPAGDPRGHGRRPPHLARSPTSSIRKTLDFLKPWSSPSARR